MPNPDKFENDLPTTPPRAQAPVGKAAEVRQPRKPVSLLPKLSMYDFKVPTDKIDAALGCQPAKER
ncbi:MAG: hypothetical protein E6R03_04470 [Hyphomicrobiaceae bacterium]|nr:MAG: hypothetical protein E6R03_04470 [Hyphomicrobiaceae bacterium]